METKKVVKRSGVQEPINISKVQTRIKNLMMGKTIVGDLLPLNIDVSDIIVNTISGIHNGITTNELDNLAATISYKYYINDQRYGELASRIFVSNMLKTIWYHISKVNNITIEEAQNHSVLHITELLWNNKNDRNEHSPLLDSKIYSVLKKYHNRFQQIIDPIRNFGRKYSSIVKMYDGHYLKRINNPNMVIETIEYMYLRIAVGVVVSDKYESKDIIHNREEIRRIWKVSGSTIAFEKFYDMLKYNARFFGAKSKSELKSDVVVTDTQFKKISQVYRQLSIGNFTLATPCMFNSGTPSGQLSSCFLTTFKEDSLPAIEELMRVIMETSKFAGGNAINVNMIRGEGAYIAGTGGNSNGLAPMMVVIDDQMKYVDQGGNKRKGVCAAYISPWNINTIEVLLLKKGISDKSSNNHQIFYALWTSDHFWRCVYHRKPWYMFDPSDVDNLNDLWDNKLCKDWREKWDPVDFPFTHKYNQLVKLGKWKKKIGAREFLLEHVVPRIQDSGIPYMLSKDNANSMNMQTDVIRQSNLCAEILLHTSTKEYAVCTLSSIAINRFVTATPKSGAIKYVRTIGEYETMYFDLMGFCESVGLIVEILDHIVEVNMVITPEMENSNQKRRPIGIGIQGLHDALIMLGIPFESEESYEFGAMVQENLQWAALMRSSDLAAVKGSYKTFPKSNYAKGIFHIDLWEKRTGKKLRRYCDWGKLAQKIKKNGLRNSVVCANMPTKSTAQVLGNSPSFEPYPTHFYKNTTQTKQIVFINEYLMKDLKYFGVWNKKLRNQIIANGGKLTGIKLGIPDEDKFKEVYKTLHEINMTSVIKAASLRQARVCQTQSMNLYFKNITPQRMINTWLMGWISGLKTLSYYVKSSPAMSEQKIGLVCSRDNQDCSACGS
jgi:ribonucleoside-diphosphate reductase alpha subunit